MSTLLSVTCGAIPFHSAPFELCARAGSSAAIRSRTLVAPLVVCLTAPAPPPPPARPPRFQLPAVSALLLHVICPWSLGINHRQTERQIWMGYSAGAPRVT
jgi:hypothetical protein